MSIIILYNYNWCLKTRKEEYYKFIGPIELIVGSTGLNLYVGGPYFYLRVIATKHKEIKQAIIVHKSKLFTGIRYYFQSKENPFWEFLDSYKSMAFVNRQRKCICLLRYKHLCLADTIKAYPELLSDAKSLKDYESKILEKINSIF